VDIWSLGCIWLEAAVWIVFGKRTIVEFRQNRRVEASQYGIDGEVFHKHNAVLDAVTNMFKWLRQHAHAEDDVTREMVSVIERMLSVQPKELPDTTWLKSKIDIVLAPAKNRFGEDHHLANQQKPDLTRSDRGMFDSSAYPVPPAMQMIDHAPTHAEPPTN